ncbi:MAG: hypothetical protein WBA46_00170 [Thermomicrobiales bacterium]
MNDVCTYYLAQRDHALALARDTRPHDPDNAAICVADAWYWHRHAMSHRRSDAHFAAWLGRVVDLTTAGTPRNEAVRTAAREGFVYRPFYAADR